MGLDGDGPTPMSGDSSEKGTSSNDSPGGMTGSRLGGRIGVGALVPGGSTGATYPGAGQATVVVLQKEYHDSQPHVPGKATSVREHSISGLSGPERMLGLASQRLTLV